ncbi:uncharacterized protein LOC102807686 [Saccoglossus kowalevskii]|uniref:Uncharacterized protein LOC102807686 n=1 Tax=Saccoglossus kowalevskii TaxID=10224 RepID=A0ABM0M557_SACKO|nr:PREDICTED: uncharacterized protein LOC102807686 [Saccoglossus kowalevskii]
MHTALVFLLVVSMATIDCLPVDDTTTGVQVDVRDSRLWLCGRLVEDLRALCRGCYAGPDISKREASKFMQFNAHTIRQSRGIIEDCCYHTCPTERKIQYCCFEVQAQYRLFMESAI